VLNGWSNHTRCDRLCLTAMERQVPEAPGSFLDPTAEGFNRTVMLAGNVTSDSTATPSLTGSALPLVLVISARVPGGSWNLMLEGGISRADTMRMSDQLTG